MAADDVRKARRQLPPLHALRAFEAAARHQSFLRAGEELGLTPGAISHHVRHLEDLFGIPLFARSTRALSLSEAGTRLLANVGPALDRLALSEAAARGDGRDTLRLSLLSSFATHWLLPRMPSFEEQHPEIDVVFDTTTRHADFRKDEVDLAIRYGSGDWPGVRATRLLTERLAPVCSPRLAGRGSAVLSIDDLRKHVLLLSYAQEPFEWIAWLEAAGSEWAHHRTKMLHDYNLVIEAAVSGQGIAMGRANLIAEQLRSGALVAPFGPPVPLAGIGHWMVSRKKRGSKASEAFATWLVEAARMDERD